MAEVLGVLTTFVILILIGLIVSLISKKLGINNILLLLLTGILLSKASDYFGLFLLPTEAMVTLAVIALVLIVFDGSSKFKHKSLNDFSFSALKLIIMFILLNLVIVMPFVYFFFLDGSGIIVWLYAAIFAMIVPATDPAAVFVMLKGRTNKVVEFLEVEAILNTPITVLLPFLVLDVITQLTDGINVNFMDYVLSFLMQIVVGMGAGVIVGLVFFKSMEKLYSDDISPLGLIAASLLAYILAENLGGNGVLSVAVLGFVFGSIYIANKDALQSFNSMLSNSLEIIVYLLLGFMVTLDLPWLFFVSAYVLFLLILCSRYLALKMTVQKEYTSKELLYMTLTMPKGIATAVVVFSLSLLQFEQLVTVGNLVVVTMLYSIIISTFINKYSSNFISIKT